MSTFKPMKFLREVNRPFTFAIPFPFAVFQVTSESAETDRSKSRTVKVQFDNCRTS